MILKDPINSVGEIFTISVLFTLSFYHFMIHFGRRLEKDEKYNFYFAFFAFTCFLYSLYNSFLYNSNFFPFFFTQIKALVEGILSLLIIFSSSKFLANFFKLPKKINNLFYICYFLIIIVCFLTSTSLIIGNDWYLKNLFIYVMIIVTTAFLLQFYALASYIFKKQVLNKLYIKILLLLGFYFYIIFYIIEKILRIKFNIEYSSGVSFIAGFFLFPYVFILSLKFNNEHKELIDLKNNLSKKVIKRTKNLKKARDKIIEQNKKLEKLNQLKDNFIANISHDFRSPLSVILHITELALRKDTIDKDRKNNYQIINEASLKLKKSIDKLLELAKMDFKGIKLNIQKIDLEQFIKNIVNFYSHSIIISDIKIENIFPEKPIKNFYTDPEKLSEIINNILSNAIKFVDTHKGKIKIKIEEKEKTILITIKDNGIGIKNENLKKLFNRFEQVHENKNEKYYGTGLGLAFAKELVNYLMGKIWAESEGINKGTVFYVELPKGKDHFNKK